MDRKKIKFRQFENLGFFCPYLIPSHIRNKLDSKTIKATFIGNPENSKIYSFVIHHGDGSISVTKRRDARFLEEQINTRNTNKLIQYLNNQRKEKVT